MPTRPPAQLRRRVLDEVAGGRPGRFLGTPHLIKGRRSSRPAFWMVPVGASVAAVGLLAAVAMGATPFQGRPTSSANIVAGRLATPADMAFGRASGTVDQKLNADTILFAAADTARHGHDQVPPASSYVYTQSKESGYTLRGSNAASHYTDVREAWLSVDDKHDGAVTPSGSTKLTMLPGCLLGSKVLWTKPECGQRPAYVADAPTTRAAMLAYLTKGVDPLEKKSQQPAAIVEAAWELVGERMVPAQARSAVFEALSTLPHVQVVTGVKTILGRTGTSIAEVDPVYGRRSELIFDPKTHQLIGQRSVALRPENGLPANSTEYSSAVITKAVVSELGLRPDGTTRTMPGYGIKKEAPTP